MTHAFRPGDKVCVGKGDRKRIGTVLELAYLVKRPAFDGESAINCFYTSDGVRGLDEIDALRLENAALRKENDSFRAWWESVPEWRDHDPEENKRTGRCFA